VSIHTNSEERNREINKSEVKKEIIKWDSEQRMVDADGHASE
jgi:hypothetical protein